MNLFFLSLLLAPFVVLPAASICHQIEVLWAHFKLQSYLYELLEDQTIISPSKSNCHPKLSSFFFGFHCLGNISPSPIYGPSPPCSRTSDPGFRALSRRLQSPVPQPSRQTTFTCLLRLLCFLYVVRQTPQRSATGRLEYTWLPVLLGHPKHYELVSSNLFKPPYPIVPQA